MPGVFVMGEIDYTIIGLLVLLVNVGSGLVVLTFKTLLPSKSVLTPKESCQLEDLHTWHKVTDPSTGSKLWYTPTKSMEALTHATTQLTLIGERLQLLISEIQDANKLELDQHNQIIDRLETLNDELKSRGD